ncbi:MAG: hypothetical protein NC120_13240 [Ruminococcus sp.]|nr:hypothetical protein [Ruminococcus sp.]
MGGRGASSGISDKGKRYGTEYTTLHQSGNIKFVTPNEGSATAPMETMTKGRVYVTVNNQNQIKSITYYDKNNKRFKQIDTDHPHKINGVNEEPHKHKGYLHNEKGDYTLSPKEQKLLDRVTKTWYNINNK